jgi:flagella basal body P-ring formation protein FlgA
MNPSLVRLPNPIVMAVRVLGVILLTFAPAAAAAQEIFLRSEATISGTIVTLGQIADISGGTPAERRQLQQLELGLISAQRPRLSAAEIREALVTDGWNLLSWQVAGAHQVTVHSHLPSGASRPTLTADRGYGAADRLPRTPSRDAGIAAGPFPTMHPSTQRTMVAQTQWRATAGADVVDPASHVAAAAPEAPQSSLLVFKQEMKRGQIVSETDLESVTATRTPPRTALVDPSQAVGQALRQTVPAGRPILATYLEPIKHVQRGSEVRLLSRIASIEVSTMARSLADGTLGQTVTVESLDRKRRYVGKIVGFHTVQIVSAEQVSDGAIAGQSNRPTPSDTTGWPVGPNNPLR